MKRITEKRDVQDQLINYLTGIGWQFIPQGDFKTDQWRGIDEANPFLIGILQEQLAKLNGWSAADARIAEVIRQLRTLPPTLAGHEAYVHWLRGHKTAYDPTQQREFNVALIDYDDLSKNVYHFTEEMWFTDRDRRRMDMVLYVNGLPVLLIENKNPKSQDPGMEGFDQVQATYTEKIPEFLKYPVPFAVPATRLEYGATWNPSTKAFYRWKTHDGRDFGLEKLSKTFFDKRMVLSLIRDYAIFYRNDDSVQKFLLRPHQIRTTEKIVERVVAGQQSLNAPDTGLEWHTQGSGKTLSMIVAAHLLRRHPQMENPTLVILVDRTELEGQMVQNLEAFGFGTVYNPGSINELRRLLKKDTRGLIVTTIHKFHEMPSDVITRRNVVVLIDEAHRSQEGDLGIYLNAALPNAFRFGFTGTPIDRGKVGRGTFEMFGKHDPQGYHDKYSINESIEDKTTVPLFYTLAPSEIWVDKLKLEQEYGVMLDEFLHQVDEEGVASIDALNRLLKKADKLMAVLKSPERIGAIAQHISNHFVENVLPRGFKAMVVTPDREACVLYKAALDAVLPPEWSVVVYSGSNKDSDDLRQYHLDEDEEKRIRKAFRDPEKLPKILIVTEKLLTGYDAPVAYAMYLDKPLRDHTLLQAIARVNRPFDGKENGLIVDYIGIFENLQRAISFDPESLSKGLIDLEKLKERFGELLTQVQEQLAPIQPDNLHGRTDRLIEYFFEDEPREAFVQTFRELQTAYEIISPDAFLRPYIDTYAAIADIYRTVISYFDPKAEERRLNRELLAKTETLIREHVGTTGPASPLPLYPINENIADVIRADNVSDQVKVINLHRSLTTHIEDRQEEQPHLLSIGDEVERIIERLRDRQISTETAIRELQSKADEIVDAQHERDASTLDNLAFSLRMVIRAHGVSDADTLATQLSEYLQANDGWRFNEALKRTVKTKLYSMILPVLPESYKAHVKTIADELLRMHAITA
jgi:type I restriction enzyme R subunit